jgi:hypothetical protein
MPGNNGVVAAEECAGCIEGEGSAGVFDDRACGKFVEQKWGTASRSRVL